MKKLIIVIAVAIFAVSLFAGDVKNPEPTLGELKNEVYGLKQKSKMYKIEIESLRKQLKKKQTTVEKLTQALTAAVSNRSSSQGRSSVTKNSAQQRAKQQAYQKKQQKEQYKKLIAINNEKLKLCYTQKEDYQKQYKYAMKQYKNAGQLIGKSRRKAGLKKWNNKLASLKYKIQRVGRQIDSLKQSNAQYAAYGR